MTVVAETETETVPDMDIVGRVVGEEEEEREAAREAAPTEEEWVELEEVCELVLVALMLPVPDPLALSFVLPTVTLLLTLSVTTLAGAPAPTGTEVTTSVSMPTTSYSHALPSAEVGRRSKPTVRVGGGPPAVSSPEGTGKVRPPATDAVVVGCTGVTVELRLLLEETARLLAGSASTHLGLCQKPYCKPAALLGTARAVA